MTTRVKLIDCDGFFNSPIGSDEEHTPFFEHGAKLNASLSTYSSGVRAVELKNGAKSSVTILPFMGQQVWDFKVDGKSLKMKSMFPVPRPIELTKQLGYCDGYGGFFLHCGMNSMGCPSKEDEHPLHGELPYAPFQEAWVISGEVAGRNYIGVSGRYHHASAFTQNWVAETCVKLFEGATNIEIECKVTNKFYTDMDLMYMAHCNFKPVPGSQLHCMHKFGKDDVMVNGSMNGLVKPSPAFEKFLADAKNTPTLLDTLDDKVMSMLNPEIVVFMRKYLKDKDGFASSMQHLPDGSAFYIKHRPDELPLAVRWMCVYGSHEALGVCLPCTAEPEGKKAETDKGYLQKLKPGEERSFHIICGKEDSNGAAELLRGIHEVLGQKYTDELLKR